MAGENPKHIIAAAALVSNNNGDILMNCNPERGWEIPGGRVKLGESLSQALVREIQEESGILARVSPLAAIYTRLMPPQMLMFMFLGASVSSELTLGVSCIASSAPNPIPSLKNCI
jgi:8-oxo-dGTP diphosphatase